MAELRRFSSRAAITPSRFVNSYSYGNFKGDESAWMARYFDAFLFQANWGARVLMLRLPAAALPLRQAKRYCPGGSAIARRAGDKVILEFRSEDEGGEDWVEEGGGLMASLMPLRAELAAGDLRGLYLAWLACVQAGELDGATEEPPCPPGLKFLSAPLQALAEFLRLDHDLLDSAAVGGQAAGGSRRKVARWVSRLSEAEKTKSLVQFMEGEGATARAQLLRRFRNADAGQEPTDKGRQRTVAGLIETVEKRSGVRGAGRPAMRGRR
jgi:hypothetical protein